MLRLADLGSGSAASAGARVGGSSGVRKGGVDRQSAEGESAHYVSVHKLILIRRSPACNCKESESMKSWSGRPKSGRSR